VSNGGIYFLCFIYIIVFNLWTDDKKMLQPEDWDDKEYIEDPEDKKPEVKF
jgi:hypothetical protein